MDGAAGQGFAAILDRYRIPQVLQRAHRLRLRVALAAAALAVAYNLLHPLLRPQADGAAHQAAFALVCWSYLGLATLAWLIAQALLRRRLLRRDGADGARERAWRVAQYVHGRGNLLLLLAASGLAVLLVGSYLGLGLLTRGGWPLALGLAPTAALAVFSRVAEPGRERLLRLHDRIFGRD
jgi:hypothetical protein